VSVTRDFNFGVLRLEVAFHFGPSFVRVFENREAGGGGRGKRSSAEISFSYDIGQW